MIHGILVMAYPSSSRTSAVLLCVRSFSMSQAAVGGLTKARSRLRPAGVQKVVLTMARWHACVRVRAQGKVLRTVG